MILKNTCVDVAPSTCAASKSDPSIPIIPAIKRMVVLPNHIKKFMVPTRPLVQATLVKNLIGSLIRLRCKRMEFTGAVLPDANKVKNSIEKAAAIIRFGK